MGLIDLTESEFKELQKIVKLLGIYGITEEDLRYLPEALKIVRNGSLVNKPILMSDSDKKALEEKMKKLQTPEEFFEQFKNDVEEFYPYGNIKTN